MENLIVQVLLISPFVLTLVIGYAAYNYFFKNKNWVINAEVNGPMYPENELSSNLFEDEEYWFNNNSSDRDFDPSYSFESTNFYHYDRYGES